MTIQSLIIDRITAHDAERPRGLQAHVGPSDLGDPCDHCLAAKLAGWKRKPELAWLPYIGTAVHAQLAQAFDAGNPFEWQAEVPVTVGRVDGRDVVGTADLFHLPTSTVVDFKVVGKTTLDKARRGDVSEQYRRQVHLYGKGLDAYTVAICFLPRNEIDLSRMVWWEEPYDEQTAYMTLKRASHLAELLGVVHENEMLERGYISNLPRAKGCYDCPRFEDWQDHINASAAVPRRGIMEGIME